MRTIEDFKDGPFAEVFREEISRQIEVANTKALSSVIFLKFDSFGSLLRQV